MTELDTLLVREMDRAGAPIGSFEDLRRRRDRRRRNERVTAGVVGVAITVAIVVVGIRLLHGGAPRPARPTPAVPTAIVGSFRSGFGSVSYRGLRGMWRLQIAADGSLRVRGELDGAPVDWSGRLRVPPGAAGAEVSVDLDAGGACSGDPPGRYSWGRSPNDLTFFVIRDPCRERARAIALAGHVWRPG